MRDRVGFAGVWVIFLCLYLPLGAQSKARVELGSDVALVAQEARVGITLNSGGEQIGGIEDEVVFPAALSFVEGELGDAGKAISATLQTELAEAAADAPSRKLVVRISAPDGAALTSGTVALLKFKAPANIDGESTDYKLDHRASVTIRGRGSVTVASEGGVVTVLKKPLDVIACFFYMH